MKKRLFQVLDDMNQSDTENQTRSLQLANAFISGRTIKQGAVIEMGVESSCLVDIMSGKSMPILLIIDKEDYFKRKDVEVDADQKTRELVEIIEKMFTIYVRNIGSDGRVLTPVDEIISFLDRAKSALKSHTNRP